MIGKSEAEYFSGDWLGDDWILRFRSFTTVCCKFV